jgi:deaminated glutathione amidase
VKIALVQMNSQPDLAYNLSEAKRLMAEAMAGSPDLIVLPEHFDWMGGTADEKRAAADFVPGGDAYELVQDFARENGVWIHAGSLMERNHRAGAVHNTTVVFNERGEHVGLYRKIHLFDITAPNGAVYAESAVVTPGHDLLVYEVLGFRIACVICYDLRFSRLFDRLAEEQVDMFVLPAAFTRQTGSAHWDVLCRARAIEYQAYFAACGQCGSYVTPAGEKRETFGHSLVCDPWGVVLAHAGDEPSVIFAELDRDRLSQVRQLIPMAAHRVSVTNKKLHLRSGRR